MTDATTQLKIGASLDGSFETTTNTAKRKIGDIGAAARDAGKSTGSIGDGMDSAAKKVESATKNMISSIQRQTAALEAGDKASRQYQESLARQRGIDVSALKPYLDQLDAVKAKQAEAARSAESFATSMGGIKAAALAAGAAAGAMVVFAKSIINTADGLNDLSQRVGISVKELGKYQLAAEQSGTSLEAISRGVKGLAKNMIENGEALRKAGIDATSADGAMQQLADIFKAMPDGIEKTTLAVELFGKSGMDLIPMLNLGSEGMRDAAMASAEYSQQMSIMAPLADQLNDQMAEIALASKTAGAAMVNEFLPSLNQIAAAFVSSKDSANGFATIIGSVVNTVVQTAALLISDVVFVLKGVGIEIGGIAAQAGALARLDFKGFTAIGDAMKEDAALARKELDQWQSDLVNGVKKANDAVQSEYNKRQGFGENSTGSTLLGLLGSKGDADAKKALAEANKELEKRAAILAELSGYTKDYEETQQRYAAMLKSGALTQDAYNRATQELVAKQPGMVALTKEQAEAQKLLDKAYADTVKLLDAYEKDQRKAIASAEDEVAKAQESYDAHGKLASVIQQEALARLENNRTIMSGAGEDLSVIDAQIAAKKKIIDLLRKGEARDAVDDLAKANKKAAEESSKYWEDALMRAFESGKGFFQSLWDTIKNTLKTQVLKVLVTGSISGLGLTGAANAATGGAGGLSLLSSLSNLPSTISSLATAVTSLPSLLSSSSMGALDILGFNPWFAAGAALLAVVANLDKGETRAGGQYGYSTDGATAYNARRNSYVNASGVGATFLEGPSGGDPYGQVVGAAINSTVDHINALFKAIGSTTAISAFQAGYETSEKGRGGVFAGGTLTGGVTFGESGTGDNYAGTLYDSSKGFNLDAKAAVEALSLDLKQATIEALQAATDMPKAIAQMIKVDAKSLTDEAATSLLTSIDALVNDVVGLRGALDTLPFADLRDLSFDAAAGLIAASGNLEALANNLAGYYDNFYSESEKTANLTQVLGDNFAALGQTMPTDNLREWYRTQVEIAMAADQSVPANAALTASLLSMQGGVSTLAKTSEDAAKAALDAAAAQKKQTEENIAATLGFDASGLSEMIMTAALNPEAGMTAAQAFSATLEKTIKDQLISNTVSSISQSIFDSIITPMMLGQAVSDATLDEITAAATARLDALDALFNSTEFQTGLQNILTSVSTTVAGLGGFGGSTTSAAAAVADQPFVQYLDQVVAAVDPIAAALEAVADRIAALKPTDTAATRAAEIAKALAEFGSEGTYVDTYITGGGKGGGDIGWVKEFIASNENAVTRALQELYELEDKKKSDEAQSAIRALQGELAKYWGDGALAAAVLAGNRAETLAQLNVQDPTGKLAQTQQDVWDAKIIYDFNRALLEASGDAAGLAAFDAAAENTALLLEGWSQSQIDQINTAKVAGENNSWVEKIAVLTGEYTDRQLQHTKDLAAATDATTDALIDQYYAQLDAADAIALQNSLLDKYKPKQTDAGAIAALQGAGLDTSSLGFESSAGIAAWFANIIAAADPLTAEGQATIATLNGLAGAVDTLAQSAATSQQTTDQLMSEGMDKYIELLKLQGRSEEALAIERERAIAGMTDLQVATYDSNQAMQEQIDLIKAQAETARVNAGWQDQLDVLLGDKTQKEVDRANALAEVTDESTRKLMLQVWAQQDMAEAATASIDAMKQLSAELDQIADFRASIGNAQQNIRSQMVGYDAVGYQQSQVDKYTAQLGAATTTTGRLDAAAGVRDAITGRYTAELDLINKNRDAAEQSARAAFDAQVAADNAAIQAANEMNAAYRQIGEYVKGLITGADAPYSIASRYAAAQADYKTTLALAQAGDKDALGRITGAQGNLLSTAREQSVSSVDYARTFGRTINELSALAAKAGPDLESVTRQFYFDSSAFDQQALDLQTSTITELEDLATLTDEWTAELQNQMAEQALAFANIGLNTQQTADYTSKIEPGFERVAVAIDSAIQAQNAQAALLAEIQGLRTEVARLSTISQKTADNTAATAQTLDSVSGGGGPLLVQTA